MERLLILSAIIFIIGAVAAHVLWYIYPEWNSDSFYVIIAYILSMMLALFVLYIMLVYGRNIFKFNSSKNVTGGTNSNTELDDIDSLERRLKNLRSDDGITTGPLSMKSGTTTCDSNGRSAITSSLKSGNMSGRSSRRSVTLTVPSSCRS